MKLENTPDWVSAIIACLLFLGATAGLYIGLTNQVTTVSTRADNHFENYDNKLRALDEYQAYLQKQVDDNKHTNTVLETQVQYMEKGQKDLADSFKELAGELRKTNEFLIEVKTQQRVKKEEE